MASTPLVSRKEDLNWNLPTTSSFRTLYTEPSPPREVEKILSDEESLIIKSCIAAVTVILSPIGMATNIINFYVFVRMGLRESVTVSTMFLAYSDFFASAAKFLVALGDIVTLVENNTGIFFFPVDPFIVTVLSNTVVTLYFMTTSLTTTYLALTRCMCVIRPLRFKTVFTVRRTVFFFSVVAAFPFLLYAPVYAEYHTGAMLNPMTNVTRTVLWVGEDWADLVSGISFVSLFVIPVTCQIIIVISTVLMIAGLKSASAFRKSGIVAENDERSRKDTELQGKERRVAYQVILISVTFLVTNMGAIITIVLIFAVEDFEVGKRYYYIYVIITEFLAIPLMLNCSSSLIIYIKFNSAFRKVLFPKEQ